jgi:hypothetical protein
MSSTRRLVPVLWAARVVGRPCSLATVLRVIDDDGASFVDAFLADRHEPFRVWRRWLVEVLGHRRFGGHLLIVDIGI